MGVRLCGGTNRVRKPRQPAGRAVLPCPCITTPLDELGPDPYRMTRVVKRIIEPQLRPADVVISAEFDRLPDDCRDGALVFVGQSVQKTRRNRDKDYSLAGT